MQLGVSAYFWLQSMYTDTILLLTCDLISLDTLVQLFCVSFSCQCLLHVTIGASMF